MVKPVEKIINLRVDGGGVLLLLLFSFLLIMAASFIVSLLGESPLFYFSFGVGFGIALAGILRFAIWVFEL